MSRASRRLLTLLRRRGGAAPSIVTDGLLAEWRFDDGSGQVLTDYSGNDFHGQLGSTAGVDADDPTWGAEGLVFPNLTCCDIPILSGTPGDWTFQVALHPSSTGSVYGAIFDADVGRLLLVISGAEDGKTGYYNGGSVHAESGTTTPLERQILTFLLSSSAGGRIYRNLSQLTLDLSTYTQVALGAPESQLAIGSSAALSSAFIGRGGDCGMSYMAIYSGILSDSDWQANYSAIRAILSARDPAWGLL
jgi:hypothetical protein